MTEEQQETAPDRPQDKAPKPVDGEAEEPGVREYVHLPGLLADEFGTSRSQARMEIALGTVEVDGKKIEGDAKFDLPRDEILGKEIVVMGDTRHFKMTYREE